VTGFVGADDSDDILFSPREHDPVHIRIDHAIADPALFAIVSAVVQSLNDRTIENQRGKLEIDAMLGEIQVVLARIPFKNEIVHFKEAIKNEYTNVYTKSSWTQTFWAQRVAHAVAM
jgi:hypothetical protein